MRQLRSITGYDDYLYDHFKESFKKAKKIDIIVSFLMESGVKLLEKQFLDYPGFLHVRQVNMNHLSCSVHSACFSRARNKVLKASEAEILSTASNWNMYCRLQTVVCRVSFS